MASGTPTQQLELPHSLLVRPVVGSYDGALVRAGVKSLVFSLLSVACAATAPRPLPIVLAPETRATLAGHRCDVGRCTCRTDDPGEDSLPEAPAKRFEFRLGSSTGVGWVTVNSHVLYKSAERAEDCFYLDLMPGKHQVSLALHAEDEQAGVGGELRIAEHADAAWYSTLHFLCGLPGACDRETLRAWKENLAEKRGALWDPCGGTKVEGVSWDLERAPDAPTPGKVLLTFTLNVYDFVPRHPPGSEQCTQ